MNDYLEEQPVYDEETLIVADGAYNSVANTKISKEHQIKLVTTNFTGIKPDDIYAEFKFTQDGHYLIECINDCSPNKCTYDPSNERSVAYFSKEACNACPYSMHALEMGLKQYHHYYAENTMLTKYQLTVKKELDYISD